MKYECTIRALKPQPVMSIRGKTTLAALVDTIGEFLREVWEYVEKSGGKFSGPPFTCYHKISGEEIEIEAGMPVSDPLPSAGRIKAGELPGGEAVSTIHYGPYDFLPAAGEALDAWVKQHGREAAGPNWEIYWTDPGEVIKAEEWKTEVIKPLTPRVE